MVIVRLLDMMLRMFKSVLMVCVGNICRSPMAEGLFLELCRQTNHQISVDSAGIGALVGHAADPYAVNLLAKRGMDISQHQAKQITQELVARHELILVMEKGHVQAVNQMIPQSRGRVHLLGKWNENEEIADPYRKPEAHFVAALSAIERGIHAWEKYL